MRIDLEGPLHTKENLYGRILSSVFEKQKTRETFLYNIREKNWMDGTMLAAVFYFLYIYIYILEFLHMKK
jgi:hypothetical protein